MQPPVLQLRCFGSVQILSVVPSSARDKIALRKPLTAFVARKTV